MLFFKKSVLMLSTQVIIAIFLFLQFFISNRVYDRVVFHKRSVKLVWTEEKEKHEMIIPTSATPTEQLSQDEEFIDTDIMETIKPSTSPFLPVGIPFDRSSWYSLFRRYQKIKRSENIAIPKQSQIDLLSAIHSNVTWKLIEGNTIDTTYIREGCIDLRHHALLIMDPFHPQSLEKKHLRNPATIQTSLMKPLTISGFDTYSLYEVNAGRPESESINNSSLTWILGSVPSSSEECIQSFDQFIPLFMQAVDPFIHQDPDEIILPFFPVTLRRSCSKLLFELAHSAFSTYPSLLYGKQLQRKQNLQQLYCYRNIIITSPLKSTQSIVFPHTIQYDCFRATTYKHLNVVPRLNLQSESTKVSGNILFTYLYYKDEILLDPKHIVKTFSSTWRMKGKALLLTTISSREIVLLYANSDIVLRQWTGRNDDYYSLFLLPRNGYVQIQDILVEQSSWAERNADGLRIVFQKTSRDETHLLESLRNVIRGVIIKKYRNIIH